MARVSVVTSFSREGFEKYGEQCLETLHRYWPTEIPLYIVSEDLIDVPSYFKGQRKVRYLNLFQSSTLANDFHNLYKDNPEVHGRGDKAKDARHNRHWRTGYSFRHDAYKFSKKVFAIDLAAKHAGSGRLIWLDADTVTFNQIPIEFFEKHPPRGYAISCLTRGQRYHSECGWVGYNLDMKETHQFITAFAELYHSGEVFNLQEWHDSWVFDWLRRKMQIRTYSIAHRDPRHPFNFSELGQYMDHLKGDRKGGGASDEHPRKGKPATPGYAHKWHKPPRPLFKRPKTI